MLDDFLPSEKTERRLNKIIYSLAIILIIFLITINITRAEQQIFDKFTLKEQIGENQYKAIIYDYPIAYEDEFNELQRINNTITTHPYDENWLYWNNQNKITTYFRENTGDYNWLVAYAMHNNPNNYIRSKPKGLYWYNGTNKELIQSFSNYNVTAQLKTNYNTNDTIYYPNALGPGISIGYTNDWTRFTKKIRIRNQTDITPPTIGTNNLYLVYLEEYELSANLQQFINNQQYQNTQKITNHSISIRKDGQELFYWPQPYTEDSNNTITPTQMYLNYEDGKLLVGTLVPKETLQNAIYPLIIDPTTELNESNSQFWDTHVSEAAATTNYDSVTYFQIIGSSSAERYTLIRFNLTDLNVDDVQDASFWARDYSGHPSSHRFRVSHIDDSVEWNPENVTWNTKPCPDLCNTGDCSEVWYSPLWAGSDQWREFVVEDTWTVGENYFDFALCARDVFGYYETYVSQEHATVGYRPYLEITYNETAGADTCTYSSGDWTIDLADNCIIDDTQDASGQTVYVTGDAGTLTIDNGGTIICQAFHYTPDDFDGDTYVLTKTGGKLSVEP